MSPGDVLVSSARHGCRSWFGTKSTLHSLLYNKRRTAWGWAYPSAARLSKHMAGVYGPGPIRLGEPILASHCQSPAGSSPMTSVTGTSTVFVVDDDSSVRSSLKFLIGTVGLRVECFESTDDFLQRGLPDSTSCLVLDVRLRGSSGLDFQRELAVRNIHIPIIFITGYGDIPMSVGAMKGGAIEFLTKPFRDQELLDAVRIALEKDRARREQGREAEGNSTAIRLVEPSRTGGDVNGRLRYAQQADRGRARYR